MLGPALLRASSQSISSCFWLFGDTAEMVEEESWRGESKRQWSGQMQKALRISCYVTFACRSRKKAEDPSSFRTHWFRTYPLRMCFTSSFLPSLVVLICSRLSSAICMCVCISAYFPWAVVCLPRAATHLTFQIGVFRPLEMDMRGVTLFIGMIRGRFGRSVGHLSCFCLEKWHLQIRFCSVEGKAGLHCPQLELGCLHLTRPSVSGRSQCSSMSRY